MPILSFKKIGKKIQILMLKFIPGLIIGFFSFAGIMFFIFNTADSTKLETELWASVFVSIGFIYTLFMGFISVFLIYKIIKRKNEKRENESNSL